MFFKQFYLGCLAHASYLIGSNGEAVVVDPQRDVDEYLAEAKKQGLSIRYIIETHLHADFVSGHRELAARTGAEIVFGRHANATFPHRAVADGEVLRVGAVLMRVLETPGHTPEGISILVSDASDPASSQKLLTGDTLFIGDVGRPDLVGSKGYTAEQMAGLLYDSLHGTLLKLDDAVEVYPAHGAGSSCGRNISSETWSTLGQQRQSNHALQPMTKEEFVHMMTTDLPPAPKYFPRDAEINRSGARPLDEIPPPEELSAEAVNKLMQQGALVVDVRNAAAYGAGHVPGSLNIGLGGQFASWAGSLLSPEVKVVLVADGESAVVEAVTRLARVGLENVHGVLSGGVDAWAKAGLDLQTTEQISVEELRQRLESDRDLVVIDVRRPGEYAAGHVPGALPRTLAGLEETASSLEPRRPTAIICASGYRSSVASGFLERRGFRQIANVAGGTTAWRTAGFPVDTEVSALS